MSQAKVDKYKEEKRNREAIIRKQKRNRALGITAFAVIAAAFIGWFGYSIYDNATRPDEDAAAQVTEWDLNPYMDYRNDLSLSYSSDDLTGGADEAAEVEAQ